MRPARFWGKWCMMASGRFGAPAIRWRMRKISCFSISVKKIRGWQYWTKWQGRFLIWVRWRVFFSTRLIWLPDLTGLWCTAWRNWGRYGKGNLACTKKTKRVWTTTSWYWIRWCCFCWWKEIKDKAKWYSGRLADEMSGIWFWGQGCSRFIASIHIQTFSFLGRADKIARLKSIEESK